MQYKTFPSQVLFYQYLKTQFAEFDYGKSCFLPPFSFMTVDGTYYGCPSLPHMLTTLNKIAGTKFDPMKSAYAPPTVLLTTTEDPYSNPNLILSGVKVNKGKIQNLDSSCMDFSQKETVDVGVESEATETLKVDWDYVEELRQASPKGDKVKLDEYALQFNVELKRNKTFDNMVKDFKDALGE